MGTFAEIQCVNYTSVYGENFLTCLENTLWDFPIPKCINDHYSTANNHYTDSTKFTNNDDETEPFTGIAEKLIMDPTIKDDYLTMSSEQDEDESTEEHSISSTESLTESIQNNYNNNTKIWPDKEFWKQLRKYYFNGCSNQTNTLKSELCLKKSKNSILYSDLVAFDSLDSGEFMDMDKKLLELLKNSAAKISSNENNINFENILTFILYGHVDNNMISDELLLISEENVLRLIFCFYMDALMNDVNIINQSELSVNGITEQIKWQLHKIIILVYKNYLTSLYGIDEFSTTTTELFHDDLEMLSSTKEVSTTEFLSSFTLSTTTTETFIEKCDLLLLQMLPSNSIVKYVKHKDKDLSLDISKIRQESILVLSDTVVEYGCAKGYILNGLNYSICDEGVWSNAQFSCECMDSH